MCSESQTGKMKENENNNLLGLTLYIYKKRENVKSTR